MIKACGDYVVVEPKYEEKIGVLHVPDTIQKQASEFYGVAVSVGPDCPYRNMVVQGDKILFQRNEGTEIDSMGKKFLALSPARILAVLK